MKPNGSVFYVDEYGTQYNLDWTTTGNTVDFTSIMKQPNVWGEEPAGFVQNHVQFRRGIVSVSRQVIEVFDGGYTIVAEGDSQYIDTFPVTFQCGIQPVDNFQYHVDNAVDDQIEHLITQGTRWTDPSNSADTGVVWGFVESNGIIDTGTSGLTHFQWIDVWS